MESKQTMENLAYYIFTLKTGKISTEKGMPRFSTTGFLFVLGRKIKFVKKKNFMESKQTMENLSHYYFYSKNKGNKHRKRHAQVLQRKPTVPFNPSLHPITC